MEGKKKWFISTITQQDRHDMMLNVHLKSIAVTLMIHTVPTVVLYSNGIIKRQGSTGAL
jgi:hypothetical protein